ncbi:hypothetical protein BH24ACT2_BH24ACT2_13290 [soil metagenome]
MLPAGRRAPGGAGASRTGARADQDRAARRVARVRALADGWPATLAEHPSADLAEGEAAARRCGDDQLACWAEPVSTPSPDASEHRPPPPDVGWQPAQRRLRVFAVEDAARSFLAAASSHHLGPDVVTAEMLATFGARAWVMVRQYRAELAALWTEMERCRAADDHEDAADVSRPDDRPRRPGPDGDRALRPRRTGHCGSVAAARAVDTTRCVGPNRSEPENVPSWSPPSGSCRCQAMEDQER